MIPTLGSKEAIFSFAQVVVDIERGKDTVAYTEPGLSRSTSAERSSRMHAPLALPLLEENGFLPDLGRDRRWTWNRLAVLWVNYPNNPTCATATLDFYERARRAGAQSTGSSSPPTRRTRSSGSTSRRRLRCRSSDLTNVAVFNTLSKRSSMTGYRSGFVAGDPELVSALRAFRPTVGTAPQEFVQRASVVAWGDEVHVERRARDVRTQAAALPRLLRAGRGSA